MRTFLDQTFTEHARHGVGFGAIGRPNIVSKHIDGPLLYFSDGQLHWLNPWQRFQLWMGWTDADRLQRKLRPRMSAEIRQFGLFDGGPKFGKPRT